jgi:4-hydroxybenzoate polyprenyltransferase
MLALSRDTIILLRVPFSLYLAPVFLLALSQAACINPSTALSSFIIIHLLVYPASNGYNSYVDRDTDSIGGLEKPPLPGRQLYYVTVVLDLFACLLSFLLVSPLFACCVTLYILASRAYSAPQVRLKKYPLTGFLVVVFFQGAFTFFMATAGIAGAAPVLSGSFLLLLCASTFQIAGAYPLTQVYQHDADGRAGVRTISMLLGIKGTFFFSGIMFFLCAASYCLYFFSVGRASHFLLLLAFFVPLVVYFTTWFMKVLKDNHQASFRNAMTMNLVSAACTGCCFILLFLLRT